MLINGVPISGFDEGDDVIQVERLVDSASHTVGADGEMTVALSSDKSGTFTFRLNQSSPSNLYLSGLIAAQENGVFIPVSAQFADTVGNDLAAGTQGYIQRPSGMTRGTGTNGQEWTVVVERLDMLIGTE